MSNFFDSEIINLFVEEGKEHLGSIESDLLLLEGECSPELVSRIFRAAHTIKGSAGCLGFERIGELAHELETVLVAVRDGKMTPNPDIVSKLLRGFDLLAELVHSAGESNERDISEITLMLRALMHQEQRIPAQEPARDGEINRVGELLLQEGVVTQADIEGALSQQQRIGEILVSQGKVSPKQLDDALTRQRTQVQNTIRVDTSKLDQLRHLVGEAVISQMHLLQLSHHVHGNAAHELRSVLSRLENVTRSLQKEILDVRMIPIGPTYTRYHRVIRDLCLSLEKKIELVIEGEETRLDKTVLERIGDPLLHLVRNSADHGLEKPEARLAAGKPETGKITLRAEQKGNQVLLQIIDDGRGMDPEKLKQKAVEKGLLTHERAQGLSHKQALELIFAAGFSTAETVTDVSGRGVGMDVVKTNIEQLNGTIELESELGQGTCVNIRLPMALALSDLQPRGMLFEAGGQPFVLPIEQIIEVVKLPWDDLHTAVDSEFFHTRGEIMPVRRVDQLLGLPAIEPENTATILVVQGKTTRMGLLVDRTIRDQEIVIKPLQGALSALPGLAGATILGDGQVLLILSADKLIAMSARAPRRQETNG